MIFFGTTDWRRLWWFVVLVGSFVLVDGLVVVGEIGVSAVSGIGETL